MVLVVKQNKTKPPANAGDRRDAGSIPVSERSPAGEHRNPLQYSCLENPIDRGAWQSTVHGVARVGYDLMTKPPQMFFWNSLVFFGNPVKVGNSGSSAFSKTGVNIWEFMVHVLLKPGLENFERYFTSV